VWGVGARAPTPQPQTPNPQSPIPQSPIPILFKKIFSVELIIIINKYYFELKHGRKNSKF
jgi:hypothetical protein